MHHSEIKNSRFQTLMMLTAALAVLAALMPATSNGQSMTYAGSALTQVEAKENHLRPLEACSVYSIRCIKEER